MTGYDPLIRPYRSTRKKRSLWTTSSPFEPPGLRNPFAILCISSRGAPREEMQRIANGFLRPGGSNGEEVVHSERFFLVDRYGRMRGSYPVIDAYTLAKDEAVLKQLEADLRKLLAESY